METYCFLGESKAPFCFNIRGARFWRKFSIFTSEKIHFKNSNMKLKNTSVYLLAGWMLAACSGGGFQKTENGVVVEVKQQQPTDVRKVR